MPVATKRQAWLARVLLGLSLAIGLIGIGRPAAAQIGSDRYASIVIDAQSGNVVSAANADDYRFPASLTKMMTLYLLFESLRDNRISLSDAVPVSAWASSMPPTKLGLVPGTYITVEQAILGLVTKSANDAAAALGELMGGDEARFAQMMTLRARSLGMSRTTFRNASGLPDWGQVTTARDMGILARHLLTDFPSYYHYFSTPYFQFHGRTVFNHQRLLQTYPGADGLKTGYTEASGYNVVTSALRGDVRLIGVVLGAASGGERDLHMASLLDQGFQREGVPIEIARHEPPTFRVPFISTANAALMREAPVQVAEARAIPARARAGRAMQPTRVFAGRRSFEMRGEMRGLAPRQVGIRAEPVVTEQRLPRISPMRPAAAAASPASSHVWTTRTAHRSMGWRYPS